MVLCAPWPPLIVQCEPVQVESVDKRSTLVSMDTVVAKVGPCTVCTLYSPLITVCASINLLPFIAVCASINLLPPYYCVCLY